MTAYETVLVQQRESNVAVLTVNRPDKLNALNAQVIADLGNAVAELEAGSVRAAILTGAGRAFVAGADIAQMATMTPAQAKAFSYAGHELGARIENARFPLIAAVNGFALGGGCELALCCDFIYASTKAKFGQPEVKLGLMPGFGGTTRLPRRVGPGRARELVYSGEMIRADEAERIGLVNRVLEPDELMPAALKTAELIATRAPLAVRESKRVVLRGLESDLVTANELEAQAFATLFGSEDQREGTSAFIDQRDPTFTGK